MQLKPESMFSSTMWSVIQCCAAAVVLTLFCGISDGYAQQEGDSPNTLLPEIDPQDIEIRSEFTARFPGIRRQPILGFNPNPRVYQIDPGREPFMETQEQVVANLPITDLSRPAAPEYVPLPYEPPISAYGRLGGGSFLSPEAEFWGVYELSDRTHLGGALDYRSGDGHLDARSSSFRFLDADAEFAARLGERTRLKLKGGGQSDFNYLPDGPAIAYDGSRKTYGSFNLGAELRNFKNSIEGWEAIAGYSYYGVDLEAATLSSETNEESVYNASFSKRWAGKHVQETLTLKLGGRGGEYAAESVAGTQQWATLQGGVMYQRLFDYSTQVTLEAAGAYAENAVESRFYFAPTAEVKHWIQDNLTVTAGVEGRPYHSAYRKHHQFNRFYHGTGLLRHTYRIDGRAEIEFEFLEGSSLKAGIGYMTAQNFPYYRLSTRSDATGDGYGFYSVNYMDANRIRGFAGITHQLIPETFWFHAQAYIQKPKLDDGNDIPFEEDWGINSGFSLTPFDKLTLEVWGDYVSERSTIAAGTLDGFLLMGGRVDIRITDTIGVYAKLLNLLSQEYEIWSGYQERPFQAYGGLTVKLD
ncbi:MAG: hypothetical protein R3224_03320 [Balneolaceae bacterium]|nr:hypothetical protein [Balneolaceae bacterium]